MELVLSHACNNTDEVFSYRTANKEDGARLDIVAESFWERDWQRAVL